MLNKVRNIFILAAIAGIGGVVASLSGVDYVTAFGPGVGSVVAAAVAYGSKEGVPVLIAYLREYTDAEGTVDVSTPEGPSV
jgi:uncharacterized protein (DUF697 family)